MHPFPTLSALIIWYVIVSLIVNHALAATKGTPYSLVDFSSVTTTICMSNCPVVQSPKA